MTTAPLQPADASAVMSGAAVTHLSETIPTIQWCKSRLRYGIGATNAEDGPEVVLLVLANEITRRATGRDDWARCEAMSLPELANHVQAWATQQEAEFAAALAEDTKGDAPGALD